MFRRGKRKLRKTAAGWHLRIEWRDGSTTLERLADVKKESYPTEVAEYAITHAIQEEAAGLRMVVHSKTIKTRNRIITAIKQRRNKKMIEKLGIQIPRT